MSKPTNPTKDSLIEAAKRLLWRYGYEAMSPRKIMEESGAGQGSFYHHFSGKKALAIAALEEVSAEMRAESDMIFDADAPAIDRLHLFLSAQRRGALGCRLGRLANESAFEDRELAEPVQAFFDHVQKRLCALLAEARDRGDLPQDANPERLARTLLSTLQGGFVLSRLSQSDEPLIDALAGARDLLRIAQARSPTAIL